MTVTGIIAEFNPFHNGHRHLLEQSQGVTVVAMSGNFVQRGEPALIDKWTRAQMALENGADLVVELPFLVAVQSADYFAQGGIDILARLGVGQVMFGTEEMIDYQQLSQIYGQKSQEMEAYLASLPDKLTYPQKTQEMWKKFAGVNFTGKTPNHILGLAYAKAVAKRGLALSPSRLPRRPLFASIWMTEISWPKLFLTARSWSGPAGSAGPTIFLCSSTRF